MNIRKIFLTMALGVFSTLSVFGQDFFRTSSSEITIRSGVVMPTSSTHEMDDATVYGVDLSRFNDFGLGYRAGLQFTQKMYDGRNLMEVPLALVYKTRSIGSETRLRNAAYGAAFSAWYDRSFSSMLGSFIMGLFSDVDVYAGITPGIIYDAFSTTLDAGADINFRLWKFCFKLMPGFHYNLTNNYQYMNIYDEVQTVKGLFSVEAGLSYSF
ncbi:MAG: hypothetical protein MJZ09_05690 [Bacteroidales bacterium]|nr:hypothetical protein [Bacteroidales bacterium]